MKKGKVVSKCGARLNKKPVVKKINKETEEKTIDFFGKKKKDETKKDNC